MTEQADMHPSEVELTKLQVTGCTLMASMVEGSLQDGQMPPADVMEWFCNFMLHNMIMIEHEVVNNDNKEAEKSLQSAVAAVASLIKIAERNKLFRLHHDLVNGLKARKLRYPTHMDLSYGGLLP